MAPDSEVSWSFNTRSRVRLERENLPYYVLRSPDPSSYPRRILHGPHKMIGVLSRFLAAFKNSHNAPGYHHYSGHPGVQVT
ncbi:hypothetical protein TMatcc_003264 [Talaromyces marneffei ATCC 18224]